MNLWAENHIKLQHSKDVLKRNGNLNPSEAELMKQYIVNGGRVVVSKPTENLEYVDNRTPDYEKRIPELIKLYGGTVESKKEK